jgi:hypothetical protein
MAQSVTDLCGRPHLAVPRRVDREIRDARLGPELVSLHSKRADTNLRRLLHASSADAFTVLDVGKPNPSSKGGRDAWHFCSDCSKGPTSDYVERDSKPARGELCDQCEAKQGNDNCL